MIHGLYQHQDYIIPECLLIWHCSMLSLLMGAFACFQCQCVQLHCSCRASRINPTTTRSLHLGVAGPRGLSDYMSAVGRAVASPPTH